MKGWEEQGKVLLFLLVPGRLFISSRPHGLIGVLLPNQTKFCRFVANLTTSLGKSSAAMPLLPLLNGLVVVYLKVKGVETKQASSPPILSYFTTGLDLFE